MSKVFHIVADFHASDLSTIHARDGIIRVAEAQPDWELDCYYSDTRTLTEETVRRGFASRPDAFIIRGGIPEPLLKRILTYRKPVVLIDPREVRSSRHLYSVFIDNGSIARAAAQHLLSVGRLKSFAFALPDKTSPTSSATWVTTRRSCFRRALLDAGKPCFDLIDVSEAEQLRALSRPVGVFAANDVTALRILSLAKKERLKVPNDLILLGADDDVEICEHVKPTLSSVKIDFFDEGRFAAETLRRLLDGEELPHENIHPCSFSVVHRKSTSDPTTGGVLVEKALDYIDRHAAEGIHVADVARHLGVSRQFLDRTFLKSGRTTLVRALQDRRLEEAKRLLRSTHLPLSEISSSTGFSRPSYLMTLFRKRFGLTCAAYRARRPFSAARRAS